MFFKKIKNKIRNGINIASFHLDCFKNGRILFNQVKNLEKQYEMAMEEKLSPAVKLGIMAYYLRYTQSMFSRIEKLEKCPDVVSNEFDYIDVAPAELQKISPELTFHEALRISYKTQQNNISGSPMTDVLLNACTLYRTACMGITYHYFKEEIGRKNCLFYTPAFIPEIGPCIAFRHWRKKGLRHYILSEKQFEHE